MQDARGIIHGVHGTSKRREDEDRVIKVSCMRHASLDDRNEEDGARANRLPTTIEKRMVTRDNKRAHEDRKAVQGDDADVDFASSHLHTLCVCKNAAFGRGTGKDIHSDIRKRNTDKCSPVR